MTKSAIKKRKTPPKPKVLKGEDSVHEIVRHIPGGECRCEANGENECGCGADWRSAREVELERENAVLRAAVESWEGTFERFGLEPDTAIKRVEELEASLPLSTNRTREQARKALGHVERHSTGFSASHGCVEVANAINVIDMLIADRNRLGEQNARLRKWIQGLKVLAENAGRHKEWNGDNIGWVSPGAGVYYARQKRKVILSNAKVTHGSLKAAGGCWLMV